MLLLRRGEYNPYNYCKTHFKKAAGLYLKHNGMFCIFMYLVLCPCYY